MDALTSSYTSWFNLESILDLAGIKYILALFIYLFIYLLYLVDNKCNYKT